MRTTQLPTGHYETATLNRDKTLTEGPPKARRVIVTTKAVALHVGRLEITHKDNGKGEHLAGVGAVVKLDGREVEKVTRLTLDIRPDELVTATIEHVL